jgi:hypothetical protein
MFQNTLAEFYLNIYFKRICQFLWSLPDQFLLLHTFGSFTRKILYRFRHLEIIYLINFYHLEDVKRKYPGNIDKESL